MDYYNNLLPEKAFKKALGKKRPQTLEGGGGGKGGGGKGGGILGTVASIAFPEVAPFVAGLNVAQGVSSGNPLQVAGGAMGLGNYFSPAASSALSGYDSAGNFIGFGEGGMASANGGFGDWGANMAGDLSSIYSGGGQTIGDSWQPWVDSNTDVYNLGGQTFSAADLPFNQAGTDIGGNLPLGGDGTAMSLPGATANVTPGTGLAATDSTSFMSNQVNPNLDATGMGSSNSLPTLDGSTSSIGFENASLPSGGGASTGTGFGQLGSGTYSAGQYGVGNAGQNITQPFGGYTSGGDLTSAGSKNMWDKITAPFTGDKGLQNSLKLGSALYGTMQQNNMLKDYQNQLKALSERADPFASQRAQYQDRLAQSYSNPTGVYNSPEYQGLQQVFKNQIERRDAAAGRRSQYGTRAVELQNNFLNYLDNYRKQLGQYAGGYAQPGAAASVYGQGLGGLYAGRTNAAGNIPNALGQIYG